jgi:SAM-dependent methyltransferase
MISGDAYADYFETPSHWGRTYESVDEGERARIDALLDLLPADAEPIVDAGCGDGVLTNILIDRGLDVVGTDISSEALRHVRGRTMRCGIDALPFEDRAFGCSVSSNVLEHLPAGTFERALQELDRVSARYVLLSVPHAEDLVLTQTRCTRCETVFHPSRHVRSIRFEDVGGWFARFGVRDYRLTGALVRRRSRRLQRFAQLVGGVWFPAPEAICPACGYQTDPTRSRFGARAGHALAQRSIGPLLGSRRSQLVVLLERTADD